MAYTDIDKSDDYFNTKLYTGTGATQSITGVGFQPDWTWIKCRSNAHNHQSFDILRGATKQLFPNINNAELTGATSLTSFDSDGFSLGNATGVNGSGQTHVAWNWLASNTTASNTDGSITSTVSANTTSGFSIVSYTGNGIANATVGHGLGSTPSFIIIKCRNGAFGWYCYHKGIDATAPEDYFIRSDTTGARVNSPAVLNDTAPGTSVFTLDTSLSSNGSGYTYIAYCFADKKGFSKFGKYTGNGNADGTYVYTGFKPAYVVVKRSDSTGEWYCWDNKRSINNVQDKMIVLSQAYTEYSGSSWNYIDFLSNGFKIRNTDATINGSGGTFIYMAFAENPFVTSTGIPGLAR